MIKQKQSTTTALTRDEAQDAMLAIATLRGRTEYGGTPAPHLRRIEARLRRLAGLPVSRTRAPLPVAS